MDEKRWIVGDVSYVERMPPLPADSLNEHQRKVAEELAKGPRGGVKGPFIPLLRSPELVERLGKVGEYLRFGSALEPRISEFVMVVVSREWTNQFEWAVHVPLALKNGVASEAIDAIAEGRYPGGMPADQQLALEICQELSRTKSVCDTTYRRAVDAFGERGVIEIATIYGYFVIVCAVMNIAHTPPPADTQVAALLPYPR
jgi:4-carboxymuconolactone decarboxylase